MDTDLKSTLKPFIDKSHPTVKEFIISGDLEDTLDYITQRYNLNESELLDLNNLVCSILLGIVSPDELLEQTSEITLLPKESSVALAMAIQDIILVTFASKISETPQTIQNGVGQSFEQIILNQAKAMQPARNSSQQSVVSSQVPENLPIGGVVSSEQPVVREELTKKPEITVPTYGGSDPYREPI